jgi:hypothetical protein
VAIITLVSKGFHVNGKAELKGSIEIREDDQLTGVEWYGNLSRTQAQAELMMLLIQRFEMDAETAELKVRTLVKDLQQARAEAESGLVSTGPAPEPTAKIPGLVDLVDDGTGPKFLVLEEGNLLVRDCVGIDEIMYIPPPNETIQWLLPQVANVLSNSRFDTDQAIYRDLKSYFQQAAQLPSDLHASLLALWTMHTYLLEKFDYSPYLLLWAVPERGKSRTARAATYAAYRGFLTETLAEANLFRWSNDLGMTLGFDVRDLWRKSEKRGSEDILLQRFEQGARVARVLWPERGKFKDTRYFDVFGASIIATNEMPGEPFHSRCLIITMPEATTTFPKNIKPEDGLPLRERLVAMRARWLNQPLPDVPKPALGRLGDILQPFAQIAALLGEDTQKEFKLLAKMLYAERMADRASSREAHVVQAVEVVWEQQEEGGKIQVETILSQYNSGLSEKQQLTAARLGRLLTALGFKNSRHGKSRGYQADGGLLDALKLKYGLRNPDDDDDDEPDPARSNPDSPHPSDTGHADDLPFDAESSLGDVESSSGDSESGLGDAASSGDGNEGFGTVGGFYRPAVNNVSQAQMGRWDGWDGNWEPLGNKNFESAKPADTDPEGGGDTVDTANGINGDNVTLEVVDGAVDTGTDEQKKYFSWRVTFYRPNRPTVPIVAGPAWDGKLSYRPKLGLTVPEILEDSKKGPDSLVTSPDQLSGKLLTLMQTDVLGLDIETSGPPQGGALDPHQGQIELVQLSTGKDTLVIDCQRVPLELLREVLEGGPVKVIHNSMFESGFLKAAGIAVAPVVDTLVLGRIANVLGYGSRNGSFELKDMVPDLLGITLDKTHQKSDWSQRPLTQDQVDYAKQDAEVLPALFHALQQSLQAQGLQGIVDLEQRILPMVNAMAQEGMCLDWPAWLALEQTAAEETKQADAELNQTINALPEGLQPLYQAKLAAIKAKAAAKRNKRKE